MGLQDPPTGAPGDYVVERINRTTVELPFRDRPGRHLRRWLPHARIVEVVEVELTSGQVGHGETLVFATWNPVTDDDVSRVLGRNAVALMWDDSLGAGLQMALFDAVARAAGVPIHRLLGDQTSDRVPLSWWAMDMPAEDWLAESERAIRAGYTDLKVKARPWFDLRAAVATLSNRLPAWFRIGFDFNETLLDAERALPVLEDLARYPQVSCFESPISEDDLAGYRRLRDATEVDVVMHYGASSRAPTPPPVRELREGAVDGFVGGGSPNQHVAQGTVLGAFDAPCWIQLRGTGISAAFSLHLGAVMETSLWPAITRHQLYEATLLTEPITVADGTAAVPDDPGLGYAVDVDAVERRRIDPPDTRPTPSTVVEVTWPDGPTTYFADGFQMLEAARDGLLPVYERGVSTRILPEDDDRWPDLRDRVADGPVVDGPN